ncbi:DUF6233 domain-containing protein [Streptomyces sp. MMS24-I2-30]|uniref:DUF6233 domain-containing protein n=1 Tax=Streptomyces sp. MMS24-I2-30 TaxID=3351564 RepID=UPI0038969FF2
MSELPPDPPRLRAILAHLEQQLADNETVGIYLRLQRDVVRRALTAAEPAPAPAQRKRQPDPPRQPTAQPGTYRLQSKIHPSHPEPPLIHTWDCTMVHGQTSEIDAQQARLALTEEFVGAAPCEFCRPDTELGLLE